MFAWLFHYSFPGLQPAVSTAESASKICRLALRERWSRLRHETDVESQKISFAVYRELAIKL